jgi:hypothetical protein
MNRIAADDDAYPEKREQLWSKNQTPSGLH